MMLLDVNLLVYAYNTTSPHHPAARTWFQALMASDEVVLLPWHSILGFLRIVTHPKSALHPYSAEEAAEVIDGWLAQPRVRIVHPGPRHWEILRRLVVEDQAPGPLVSDAYLAAIAIEHGASLQTHDRGFVRFTGLDVRYPLA